MDSRTKILAGLFGAVLLYALVSSIVYPRWIEPMLNIDERIAKLQTEYDRLDQVEQEVERARAEYRALVARVGAFEPVKAETEVRTHINALIEKHNLQDANVAPSRPMEDRKTGLTRMQITVTALGKLRNVVGFLKEVAEMPHLVRTGNAALYPASSVRRGESRDRINFRLPLELLVLPQQRLVGRLDVTSLVRPEEFPPRHLGRDYALLWNNKPFTEPIPLSANAGSPVTQREGRSVRLTGTASGGEPPYACQWEPSENLSDPTDCRTEVDTSRAFQRMYTLTVTDDEGETATANVAVNITEKPTPRGNPTTPHPVATGPQLWRDARNMKLAMTLLRKLGDEQIGEVMVENNKARQTQYYGIGDDFHGGKLVYVHPRGAVVRRSDAYLLFPVGGWLNDEIKADDEEAATYYPDLKEAADKLREADQAADKSVNAKTAEPAQIPPKDRSVTPKRTIRRTRRTPDAGKDQGDQATPAPKPVPTARRRSLQQRKQEKSQPERNAPRLKRKRP